MKSQAVLRFAGVMVLLLVGVGAARAEFCEDLSLIVDSAPDGFATVRGDLVSRHQDPLSDTRVVWQCTLALTGAQTCEVEWLRQAYTYNTFWHKHDEEANTEVFRAVSELLEGCGLAEKQTSKSGRSALYAIEDVENLEIILARNARRVRLSFTTLGFPNP